MPTTWNGARRNGRARDFRSEASPSLFCAPDALCAACTADQAFLRQTRRPVQPSFQSTITAVDLFAGCGGISVGLQEAARRSGARAEVVLAIDNDADALAIYKRNVRLAANAATVGDVAEFFNGALGTPPTPREAELADRLGTPDVLLGGPPCQGHSDLNNHTRRRDPKNALYLRMARAAEVLKPKVVIIENVAAVQWDTGKVVKEASSSLQQNGYSVSATVLDLARLGVPQRRRRFVLIGSRLPTIDPQETLKRVGNALADHDERTVHWAISDLLDVESETVFDTPSRPTADNRSRIAYLFEHGCYNLPNDQRPECHQEGGHSYNSVYGRLWWHKPAQTITTGFGCMGQGRYVHPQRRRTLTPHEAARLQTFPDWFDFGDARRGVLAKVIGNAVPPLMMIAIGECFIPSLTASSE